MSEREIWFRGKRVDNGEWIEGGFLDTLSLKKRYVGNMFECEEVIPETFGKYTGLTDKNGTKIFEGDIIAHEGTLYEVKYSTGQVRFLAVLPNGVFNPCAFQACVVIGNIHDNPELLKGE